MHSAIDQRLKEDGLDPQCDDSVKVLHVWKLYTQTEVCINQLPNTSGAT